MPVLKSLAVYVKRVCDLFPKFITRQSRIDTLKSEIKLRTAPLERELRLLVAEQEGAEKELASDVAETGPMIVNGYVLETEQKTAIKRTAIGVKELLDALKKASPHAARTAELTLARIEEDKRSANQVNAVVTTEFHYRTAAPHERAQVFVNI